MQFCSLGSGSRGNGTLVRADDACVLVDCGFSLADTEARLKRSGCEPESLQAILVTHEHGDHMRGVAALSRRYGIPVYATAGTWRGYGRDDVPNRQLIRANEAFRIGPLQVQAVPVPHDTHEPCQFVLQYSAHRVGLLTDLGSITAHVREAYADCDALLLEFNHDETLLRQGPYPPSVQQRVGGNWGHLSNAQAADFLDGLPASRLQHLLLAHISLNNNSRECVEAALASCREQPARLHWADQEAGSTWLALA